MNLLVTAALAAFGMTTTEAGQCLGDQAHRITFANANDTLVPGLHEVRLSVGAFPSQYGFQYIAQIVLEEIMGINVKYL